MNEIGYIPQIITLLQSIDTALTISITLLALILAAVITDVFKKP